MGRVALVTGGTRGIGAAIATSLKDAGYGRRQLRRQRPRPQKLSPPTPAFPLSSGMSPTTRPCVAGVAQVAEQVGPVEVLINNAGISRDGFCHMMGAEDWDRVINVDLCSCFHMSHEVLTACAAQTSAHRQHQLDQRPGRPAGRRQLCRRESRMLGFTKAVALENARKGITVNAICPGYRHRSDLGRLR